MNEEWKDIVGYEGLYQVSNLGRVKSVSRVVIRGNGRHQMVKEKILKYRENNRGYLFVCLYKNGVAIPYSVHRLVAEAFIPNGDLFATTVNHKDEDKTNNRVDNLEWMNGADNIRYSHRDGGTADFRGSNHPRARQVRCVETGQVFGTATDASIWLGFSRNAVATSIRRDKCAGGYHWEFA